MGIIAALTAALNAFTEGAKDFKLLVAAYQTDVKNRWSVALQSSLQPLEQGKPATPQEAANAAKGIADAIAHMPSN